MEKKLGKKISRRTFLKGAVAGTALLGPGIPYIAKKAVAAEPLYIGVVSPASGNYADHGMMERMGMQMAAAEIKNVLGRPVFPFQLDELGKAGDVNPPHTTRIITRGSGALVQLDEIGIIPERLLELLALLYRQPDGKHLEKNVPPRHQRNQQQQSHHQLHQHAGIPDQVYER